MWNPHVNIKVLQKIKSWQSLRNKEYSASLNQQEYSNEQKYKQRK